MNTSSETTSRWAAAPIRFSVGLEQGNDGATRVHSFSVPGCVAQGPSEDAALQRFPDALADWLLFLAAVGDPVPPLDAELEVVVDEWLSTEADVAGGQTDICFEDDLRPLADEEIQTGLRRLGDLRGRLLARIRRLPEAELDHATLDGWPARRILDELARAQWWTLSRLGASPLAEVPPGILGRLDTAMALAVQQFGHLPTEARGRALDLDGELWTPRKVLRRLLWLEWSLGQAALSALSPTEKSG